MARRCTGLPPSICTVIRTGSRPNAFAAPTKYAAEPILPFKPSSVSSIIMASIPIPCHYSEILRRTVVDNDLHQIQLTYLPAQRDLDSVHFLKWKIQSYWNTGVGQNVGNSAAGAVPATSDNKINVRAATACLVIAPPGSSTLACRSPSVMDFIGNVIRPHSPRLAGRSPVWITVCAIVRELHVVLRLAFQQSERLQAVS